MNKLKKPQEFSKANLLCFKIKGKNKGWCQDIDLEVFFYKADPAEGAKNSINLRLAPSAGDASTYKSFLHSQPVSSSVRKCATWTNYLPRTESLTKLYEWCRSRNVLHVLKKVNENKLKIIQPQVRKRSIKKTTLEIY